MANSYSENRRFSRFGDRIQRRMQAAALKTAQAVLATTKQSAAELESVRDQAGCPGKAICIYNGFDPDDFSELDVQGLAGTDAPYRIAYIGTLWNLTSVEYLVNAVRKLCEKHPEKGKHIELVFAGRRTAEQESILQRLHGLPCRVIEKPYVNHGEAIELMRTANSLALLLADVPEASRCVPAKLFEYMAARRPILAITPPGEVWDLLDGYPAAQLYRPNDAEGIGSWLASEIDQHRAGSAVTFNGWSPMKYARPSQARQLAEIMDRFHAPVAGSRD